MSVFIVSAPSGAGKTTLNRRLVEQNDQILMSVSHTTRKPRSHEVNGKDYHFVSEQSFHEMVDKGEFIEWAKVHGAFYGTSSEELQRIKKLGKIAILEIDVQGWANTRSKLDAASIFIFPPSLKSLWSRLESRGTDSDETRWLRFCNAYEEIESADTYDFFVVNRHLDEAYVKLKSIVVDGTPDAENKLMGPKYIEKLRSEFSNSEWIAELRAKFSQ